MTDRVRVVIADNHPLYRDALAGAVRQWAAFELVGESSDGAEALTAIRELCPDVAVLDHRMPRLDGMAVLDAVIREGLGVRVLFLSGYHGSDLVYAAVAGGAAGYLSKDTGAEGICQAIAAVAAGETVLAPELHGLHSITPDVLGHAGITAN
jgi:two-component system nitrate/nitrite response regulator NarL